MLPAVIAGAPRRRAEIEGAGPARPARASATRTRTTPALAVRRRAAAPGHSPRAVERADAAPRRRADRSPGLGGRRRGDRTLPPAARCVGQTILLVTHDVRRRGRRRPRGATCATGAWCRASSIAGLRRSPRAGGRRCALSASSCGPSWRVAGGRGSRSRSRQACSAGSWRRRWRPGGGPTRSSPATATGVSPRMSSSETAVISRTPASSRIGSGPGAHPASPAGRRGHERHARGQSASRARWQERHALRQRRGEPGCARRRGDRPVEAARRPAPGSASPEGGHGRRRRAVDAGDRARRHVLGARLSREGLEARSAHRGADRRRAPRPAEQRHAAVRHGVSGLLPGLRQPGARALGAAQCDQGPVAPWIRRRSRVPARGREHRGRPRLPVHRRGRRGRKAPVRLPRPGAGALARRRARGRSRRASCSRRGSRGRSSWSRSATGPCSPSG